MRSDKSLFAGDGTMEQIPARFHSETMNEIKFLAEEHDLPRAEVIRRLVKKGLHAEYDPKPILEEKLHHLYATTDDDELRESVKRVESALS